MTQLLIILIDWEPFFISSWFHFWSRFHCVCRCRCACLQERPDKTFIQISKHCCMLSLGIRMAKQTIPPSPDFGLGLLSWTSSHVLPQSFHLNCSFDLFRALMYLTHIYRHDSKTKTTSIELDVNTVCRLVWRNTAVVCLDTVNHWDLTCPVCLP